MLKDLLVLELASVLAGPSVGQWLAELGATVLKIEHFHNGGDVTRTWKLPTEAPEDDRPAYFTSVNWGKQSIGLDLRHKDGQALLHQLVEKADVLIASFKQGDAAKLAADPDTLRKINPKLIYADLFQKVLFVAQEPIAQHQQSTVATYSGAMDHLRTWFAGSPEAKAAGLKKSAFSYLHKDGMCPDCKGMGQQKTALDFLGDIWTPCETCSGQRFQPKVLACVVNGLHIGNWLQLHVSEALERTKQQPKLHAVLAALSEVGLGHLLLGQSCKTLSGGEAQRLKLALELIHHRKGRNLYLFDEPSAGLHAQDVAHLLGLFEKMAADGHTILYIEHHPAMVAAANQVVVLGPDGGNAGGELLSDGLS